MQKSTPLIRTAVLACSLVAAACSGGTSGSPTTTAAPTTTAPTTTTTQRVTPGVEGAAPLTGLPADAASINRSAVAVKYGNADGKATPQVGINAADVVYEIQVEGQVTRLLAIFHSTDAAPVGPVRSARASEIGALSELNTPVFVWHGNNQILGPQVRASDIVDGSIDAITSVFYRQAGRSAPYNSFVEGTAQVRAAAKPSGTPPPPLFFYRSSDAGLSRLAVPASQVTIRFPFPFNGGGGEAPVVYDWVPEGGVWIRNQNGEPHVDGDGVQIAAQNVIVRFVEALDSGTIDGAGTRVPTAQFVGQGAVWVFTGGHVVTGTWVKPDLVTPTRYVDDDGNDIRLAPGRTWISLPYGQGESNYK